MEYIKTYSKYCKTNALLWSPDSAGKVKVIELQQDHNDNANEIRIVLPSDDDLWVALCALTPVSTTNRPFLDRQQTHTQHIRADEKPQVASTAMSINNASTETLIMERDDMIKLHACECA